LPNNIKKGIGGQPIHNLKEVIGGSMFFYAKTPLLFIKRKSRYKNFCVGLTNKNNKKHKNFDFILHLVGFFVIM